MKGFETFFQTIKPNLKDSIDLIVSVVHWVLIQDFDLKFLAIDTQLKPEYKTLKGTELLTSGWNNNSPEYNLIYRSNDELFFLLNGSNDENDSDAFKITISNLSHNTSEKLIQFSIIKKIFINLDDKTFDSFDSDKVDHLATFIRQNLMNFNQTKKPIIEPKSSSSSSSLHDDNVNPLAGKFAPAAAQPRSLLEDDPNRLIYPPIGGSDLDPLGQRMGGGMIFDPFAGNRFRPHLGGPSGGQGPPPGSIPPGARFDPFGPIPDNRFFKPNPDHLPPPGGPGFGGFI